MKSCPNCRLTFADETFNFCLEDGSPLSLIEELEVETIIRFSNITNQPSLQLAVIIEPIVAINIAQQFPYVKNENELYEVTRGLWRLSKERAEKASYAFAVYRGEIKEVYEIAYWEKARFDIIDFWVDRKKEQGVEIKPEINERRYQFFGHIAPNNIRNKYLGKELPQKHGQNPIRYFNC